ncbi:MAG: PulJ/GspJ family protein [Planctomycetota bacterium]|jgi:hypothetical protein
MMITERTQHAGGAPRSRAFTIAELLVAIGSVAILTVGIGRIASSINDIVSRGGAIEEVQATARAVEQLMRKDFQLLNDMLADETYIAIRARELGTPTRPIYRSQEDKRADRSAGITPYDDGSLAIHARLDEIVFIAGNSNETNFTSKQTNGFFSETLTQASKARIYYGHGLKPKPFDPSLVGSGDPYAPWPDRDPANRYPNDLDAPRVPPRIPQPDGYFGDQSNPSEDPSRLSSIDRLFGRNEYANDWVLARQPVLLAGSLAMGDEEGDQSGEVARDIIMRDPGGGLINGSTQGVAPTLLDRATYLRWWDTSVAAGSTSVEDPGYGQAISASYNFWQVPIPRLIRHGRTDIAAQSHIDFRNWIEGDAPTAPAAAWNPSTRGDQPNALNLATPPLHGVAHASGGWLANQTPQPSQQYPSYGSGGSVINNNTLDEMQSPLWSWGPKAPTTPDVGRIQNNVANMRSALANSIIRPIVEPEAKLIDRIYESSNLDLAPGGEGFLDNHAVISAHCSNFEIAWADGSVANRVLDVNADGVPEYFPGDIIWFDISRVRDTDPNNPSSLRQTMGFFANSSFANSIDWKSGEPPRYLSQLNTTNAVHERIIPEVRSMVSYTGSVDGLTGIENSVQPSGTGNLYNPEFSGGQPDRWLLGNGNSGTSTDMGEYLTIWPFRKLLDIQDAIDEQRRLVPAAWPKPSLIRVRMTLHDRGGVLRNGKEFEFIFNVNLRNP